MGIREEFELAKRDYELAIEQEKNAVAEFIDVAIMNTNAAELRLQAVLNKAKAMGYSADALKYNVTLSKKLAYN